MRILTGLQPSGNLHIGNYFGAMRQLLELQQKGETFLFIADYHALTTGPKADDLRSNVYHLALDFLSCGLSLDNTVFFRQSDVCICCKEWVSCTCCKNYNTTFF